MNDVSIARLVPVMAVVAAAAGCQAVPDVVFAPTDATSDDAATDALFEAPSDAPPDAPYDTQDDVVSDAAVVGDACPSSPGAITCCGDIACGGDCNATTCAKCINQCSVAQLCCVHSQTSTCHPLTGTCP
jgi:hypothetical protein